MGLSQRIHPELIAKVQEYVSIGTIKPVEIQRLLRHHVNNYMCTGNLPNPSDRAYYPSLIDVKKNVARAKQALQLSIIDQENAEKIIQQQSLDSPESKYFFRPYKYTQANSTSTSVSDAESYDQTLLWVHQEPWQQKLMISYGNTMSLMDATYKTTRYCGRRRR